MEARLTWAQQETLAVVLAAPNEPSKVYARRLSVAKRTVDYRLNDLYRVHGIDGRRPDKKARLLRKLMQRSAV